MKPRSFLARLLLVIFCLVSVPVLAAAPTVLVTIKPLHALVSGLCAGIKPPLLLLNTTQSPHDYQLKPSERRMLEAADVIIYASNNVESFMAPLANSLGKQQVIALDSLPGLSLLPARGSHSSDNAETDGHIWLAPRLAGNIVQQLALQLAQLDPEHRDQYFANRDRLLIKLDALHHGIEQLLTPLQQQPFLQFHDALQYFEHEFALTSGQVVTTGSEHAPGAKHIHDLQQQVLAKNIRCFFYEPPLPPKLLQTLDVKHTATVQALDIHGSQLETGEDMYFKLLNTIAQQIHSCLLVHKD